MTTLRVSFTWEEGEEMPYDELIERLMFLGAYDIDDEVAPEPESTPQTEPKRKKKP